MSYSFISSHLIKIDNKRRRCDPTSLIAIVTVIQINSIQFNSRVFCHVGSDQGRGAALATHHLRGLSFLPNRRFLLWSLQLALFPSCQNQVSSFLLLFTFFCRIIMQFLTFYHTEWIFSPKHTSFSRAYIDFNKPEDVIEFAEFFNGHVFVNEKGNSCYHIININCFIIYPIISLSVSLFFLPRNSVQSHC